MSELAPLYQYGAIGILLVLTLYALKYVYDKEQMRTKEIQTFMSGQLLISQEQLANTEEAHRAFALEMRQVTQTQLEIIKALDRIDERNGAQH